jgi:D-glycero-alpha-D-manno-heptose-7-phosphate kinase
VSQLQLPNSIWWELERRLLLVYLGKAHSSSEVHGQVIKRLEGNAAACEAALAPLRQAAHTAKDALCFGDFGALGEAMTANTEAQAGLHPGLVSTDAQRVIELAREHGATGWKVNGAGGDGGSMSILCGADGRGKRRLIEAVESVGAGYRVIPTYLSRVGLRRWSGSA